MDLLASLQCMRLCPDLFSDLADLYSVSRQLVGRDFIVLQPAARILLDKSLRIEYGLPFFLCALILFVFDVLYDFNVVLDGNYSNMLKVVVGQRYDPGPEVCQLGGASLGFDCLAWILAELKRGLFIRVKRVLGYLFLD